MNAHNSNAISRQINLSLPEPVLTSLDQYIYTNNLDISRSSLIKYLLSAYGSDFSSLADLVYQSLLDDDVKKKWLTLRSNNDQVLSHSESRVYRLVAAMVNVKIDIKGYFEDGEFV